MTNAVAVINGGSGMSSEQIRDNEGKILPRKLKEILQFHPDCLSDKEAKELLMDALDDLLACEEELRATRQKALKFETQLNKLILQTGQTPRASLSGKRRS